MHSSSRGAASSGFVGGIVVVAILVVAGLYFYSDVFRTKTDAAVRNLTQWTPENIQADPVAYMDFVEQQANESLRKLEASQIQLNQHKAKLEQMKEDNTKQVTNGEKAIAELKDLYRKADADGSWPVQWRGEKRDAKFVKDNILSLHREIEVAKDHLQQIDKGLGKVEIQNANVRDARSKAKAQLTEIAANRETLKIDKISKDLTAKLVDMKSTLSAIVTTAGTEPGDLVTLADLSSGRDTAGEDAAFDAIMSEK